MNFPVIGWSLKSRSNQLVRVPDATTYSIGDILAPTPSTWLTFSAPLRPGATRARIIGVDCVIECSTGTIALPNFDLLLFEPATNIPFAAGSVPADNAALNITAAAYRNLIGVFRFPDTGWRNAAGGTTASGTTLVQATSAALQSAGKPFVVTDQSLFMSATNTVEIRGLVQMQNAFNPGAVGYTFDFILNVDSD